MILLSVLPESPNLHGRDLLRGARQALEQPIRGGHLQGGKKKKKLIKKLVALPFFSFSFFSEGERGVQFAGGFLGLATAMQSATGTTISHMGSAALRKKPQPAVGGYGGSLAMMEADETRAKRSEKNAADKHERDGGVSDSQHREVTVRQELAVSYKKKR